MGLSLSGLPAVVAECLVGFGHLVSVFAFLHGRTARLNRVEKLACEPLFHRVLVAGTAGVDQPTDRKGFAAFGTNLNRNLIRGTTNTARANLDRRFDIVESFMEHFDRGAFDLAFNAIQRVVDDRFRDRLLAVDHKVVHELAQHPIAELGIGQDFALFRGVTTRHLEFLLLGTLGAVFRTALLPILDALGIQNTAQNVVTHTGKVFDTTATDQNHRVLLKVVALTGDIADHLVAIRQAHLGNLPHGRVRLLRRGGIDARADAALLRTLLEVHRLRALDFGLPRLADQLLDRWHSGLFPVSQHICVHEQPRAVHWLTPYASAKRKYRNRSHSEVNDAVGYQRIGAVKMPGSCPLEYRFRRRGRPPEP